MRRLHPFSAASRVLRGAVTGGTAGFALGIAGGEYLEVGPLAIALLAPLAALLGAAAAGARYYRFTYGISGDRLVVASGVFDRREREIPVGRIQNVDLERGVVHRALGLAVVRFETAGGSATEAVLDAVSLDEARRLQEAVAGRRGTERSEQAAGDEAETSGEAAIDGDAASATSERRSGVAGELAPDERERAESEGEGEGEGEDGFARGERTGSTGRGTTLYELPPRKLLALGLLSFRPGAPVLTVVSLPVLGDLAWLAVSVGSRAVGGPAVDAFADLAGLSPVDALVVVLVGLVEFVVASWLISGAVGVASYYDFRLERAGDELRYERGLVSRYSGSIPLGKVQTVTVRENALMRRLGYATLSLETAGYGPGSDDAANVAIPIDDRETVLDYVAALAGVEGIDVERPPERARRRYAVRFALVPLVLVAILGVVDARLVSIPYWYAPVVAVALAPLAGHLRWANRGHALRDRAYLARSGFWRRGTRVVPYYRVQTVIETRNPFQRWHSLASVTADTASTSSLLGGNATAFDVEDATARSIAAELRERLADALARRRRGGARIGSRPLPGERPDRQNDESGVDEVGNDGSEADGDGTEDGAAKDGDATEHETGEDDATGNGAADDDATDDR